MNLMKFLATNFKLKTEFTYKLLKSVYFKGLLPNCTQIHFQLRADLILLKAFADLKDFICDAFGGRSWRKTV